MADTKKVGFNGHHEETITAGNSTTFTIGPLEHSLALIGVPVSGGTLTVETTLSTAAKIAAGTASWYPNHNTTTAFYVVLGPLSGVMGIRVTATTQNAVVSMTLSDKPSLI